MLFLIVNNMEHVKFVMISLSLFLRERENPWSLDRGMNDVMS